MKKSIAACLISGFIFIVLGIITIITSVSMGVAEEIGNIFDESNIENLKTYTETYDSVTSIDFDVDAADLEVTVGDVFSIEYSKQENADFETCVDENGVWHIKGSQFSRKVRLSNIISWFVNNDKQTIYITIPADTVLSNVDIKADAGNIVWDSIRCDDCNISLNAGNIELDRADVSGSFVLECAAGNIEADSCTAQKIDMSADAGNIEIGAGEASEVYISVDMGNIEWSGDVGKSMNMDSNMGNITIRLPGSTDDYNIYADSNMGSITLNDRDYSGLEQSISVNNSASKTIYAESDLGNIDIYIRK